VFIFLGAGTTCLVCTQLLVTSCHRVGPSPVRVSCSVAMQYTNHQLISHRHCCTRPMPHTTLRHMEVDHSITHHTAAMHGSMVSARSQWIRSIRRRIAIFFEAFTLAAIEPSTLTLVLEPFGFHSRRWRLRERLASARLTSFACSSIRTRCASGQVAATGPRGC